MILKIVTLFLVFIAVLAMFGKLHILLGRRWKSGGRPKTCPDCGRFLIGRGPCTCKTKS